MTRILGFEPGCARAGSISDTDCNAAAAARVVPARRTFRRLTLLRSASSSGASVGLAAVSLMSFFMADLLGVAHETSDDAAKADMRHGGSCDRAPACPTG